MAVTQDGGHMLHSTTEDVSPERSEKTIKTGGPMFAKSNPDTLTAAYPLSPIIGVSKTYTAAIVAGKKNGLMTNTIEPNDRADAASYYGFTAPESDEAIPSSADMHFPGPDIASVKTDKNSKPIASPYMPNLLPPDSFNPIQDNPTAVVVPVDKAGAETTPGVGNGLMNPKASSAAIQSYLIPSEDAKQGENTTGAGSGGGDA